MRGRIDRARGLRVGAGVALVVVASACASLEGITDIKGVDGGGSSGSSGGGGDAAGSSSGSSGSIGADGSDAPTCAESTTQCDPGGGGVETCTSWTWSTPVPCAQGTCAGGACTGSCTTGASQCSGTGLQKCTAAGQWGTPTACSGAHQSCTGGGDAGPAGCTCNADPCSTAGTGGAAACEGPSTLATCAQDGQGCWFGSSPTACTNGACFGSAGSAQCCTNMCTVGATQCVSGQPLELQTCTVPAGGNGCSIWSTSSCGAGESCSGQGAAVCTCSSGLTSCGTACVDTTIDSSNCGTCGKACPVLTAPSSGATCASSACSGHLGNAVAYAGANVGLDTSEGTVYFVKVTTPATAGSYQTVCASVGSTEPSGTSTQVILGLFSDSAGQPGAPLLYTNSSDAQMHFNNPDPPHILCADGFITPSGTGFAGIAPSTSYWVYMKVNSSLPVAGPSTGTSGCVSASWLNVDPPCCPTTFGSCPGNIQAYLVESFP